MIVTEDDFYRTSTQYRLWSFTPEALASRRAQTNATAAERVKKAIQRARDSGSLTRNGESDGDKNGNASGSDSAAGKADAQQEIECLTVAEERKLVEYYCGQCLELGKFFEFPINVVATAVQFMKRFYLSNSPMTYHPKLIMPSALFLATKTENNHIYLKDYAARLSNPPKRITTPEDILAPEFIITQGLRFTFDVRHPHRALKGGHMELLAMASGLAPLPPHVNRSAADIKQEMQRLPTPSGAVPAQQSPEALVRRLENAYGRASETLKAAAILTDAYFLYTPAQIWLAALLNADEPLTLFYLNTKLPSAPSVEANGSTGAASAPSLPAKDKVLATIRACAALLSAGSGASSSPREELVRIDKKLYRCRNPEKLDLVGLNRAVKRDGGVEGELDASAAKRRKLEREKIQKEGEELFGPGLT